MPMVGSRTEDKEGMQPYDVLMVLVVPPKNDWTQRHTCRMLPIFSAKTGVHL